MIRIIWVGLITTVWAGCNDDKSASETDTVAPEADTDTDTDTDTDADADADADADTDTDTDADADDDTGSDIPADNQPPPSPGVAILAGPASGPYAPSTEGLLCVIENAPDDPNGDRVQFRFDWSVDGVDVDMHAPDVSHVETSAGETWTCSVTPNDGWVDGIPGTASVQILNCSGIETTGGSSGVEIPSLSGVELGAEFTIETCVRWNGPDDAAWHTVFAQGIGTEETDGGWSLMVASTADTACGGSTVAPGTLVATVVDGPCATTTSAIPTGEWAHLTAVLDSGIWWLFVNGSLDTDSRIEGLTALNPDAVARIGTATSADGDLGFVGVFDDVHLSSAARYDMGFDVPLHVDPDPDTIGLWHFDEGEGDTSEDASGIGHTADLDGALWTSQSTCDVESR